MVHVGPASAVVSFEEVTGCSICGMKQKAWVRECNLLTFIRIPVCIVVYFENFRQEYIYIYIYIYIMQIYDTMPLLDM